MRSKRTKALVIILIVSLFQSLIELIIGDEYEYKSSNNYHINGCIANMAGKDIYNEIRNSCYFIHWINAPANMYNYIKNNLSQNILETKKCKIIINDIVHVKCIR